MISPTNYLETKPAFRSLLDPEFVPAALWNRAYRSLADKDPGARTLTLALCREGGPVFHHETRLLSANHPARGLTLRYVERLLKFLLWQKGGARILLAGADEIAAELAKIYSSHGARKFDAEFIGEKVYGAKFSVAAVALNELPPATVIEASPLGRNLDGCRIGFDLGGSDRKAAAVIEGKVVFSEEIPWDPYFQSDPAYHIESIHESLTRAAAHLPRVNAIGGSAAGVYVNNEVRAASLFRGVPADKFEKYIRRIFFELQARWGGVPFEVVNDGEVTALAGSMALGKNAVLGISMGTSQAGGYVTSSGGITPWLNELAFAPIDYRLPGPPDEWSGDEGCGVQYFSQQGVARLAVAAGFEFPATMPLAERLVAVQQAMEKNDPRARGIYEAIGIAFGYAIAHYAEFYEFRHVLVLGRVTTGAGGDLMLNAAREVLRADFPSLTSIELTMPPEGDRRHGQAIAAASLPRLRR